MSNIPNLPPETIFRFICNDFETAWNGVARQSSGRQGRIGRGNFMFALQAMILMEWACRLCAGNSVALAAFGKALYEQRPAYFLGVTSRSRWLNGVIESPRRWGASGPDVLLPPSPRPMRKQHRPLLWLLWDNIRNGQAHQYQQIPAHQRDGDLYIALAGAEHRLTLKATVAFRLHEHDHLAPERKYRRALGIAVYPQWLYLDLRDAIIGAGLLGRGLAPTPLTRSYDGVNTKTLAAALRRAQRRFSSK